jgi:5'-nucleotidase
VLITVIGTSDLHGAVERTAVLSGYLKNVRAARAKDHGGVLLIDAGDLLHGTLVANLGEGAAVVNAYNLLGYTAAALGNHEFDFGPEGEAETPKDLGDDPQGALRARAREAKFPFLSANVVDKSGHPLDHPNIHASVMVNAAKVKVGILGVSTEATVRTTLAANMKDLRVVPLAATVVREASVLRRQGAQVVIVAAHAGGKCEKHDESTDLSSCKMDEEVFRMVQELPLGLVDVVVAGHTHQAVAHQMNGVAIIQSYAHGRAFGRVDLTVDPSIGGVMSKSVSPPRDLCQQPVTSVADCQPGEYEGAPVELDQDVLTALSPALERARSEAGRLLGARVAAPLKRAYAEESELGNLVADLMRQTMTDADASICNAGGIRADLEPGELTYGALYDVLPFDNRFAFVSLTGAQLKEVLASNLQGKSGILCFSGFRAQAQCKAGKLAVDITKENGSPVANDEMVRIVTSDYLATGGDGVLGFLRLSPGAVKTGESKPFRDVIADKLAAQPGVL